MRPLTLALTITAAALAGAVAAKLHTRLTSSPAICANVDCAYLALRLDAIRRAIAARPPGRVYLVIGDSLTERARWPVLCGMSPLPAGIGGARSDTWLPYASGIAQAVQPSLIVLALGTNDVLSQGRLGPYEAVVASLASYETVAVPVHGMPRADRAATAEANARILKAVPRMAAPIDAETSDGIHLTAADYGRWLKAIEKAACRG